MSIESKPAPGYEDSYLVTRDGRVFTIPRVATRSDRVSFLVAARERKPVTGKNGYLSLFLSRNGKKSCVYVHRLVAELFVDGMSSDKEVNHCNGDKTDNRAENLEWVTRSENNAHKYRVLNQSHPMSGVRGAACKYSTPVQGFNLKGEVVVEFSAMKDAQRAGYKAPAISRCIKSGKIHRGLRWRLTSQTTKP